MSGRMPSRSSTGCPVCRSGGPTEALAVTPFASIPGSVAWERGAQPAIPSKQNEAPVACPDGIYVNRHRVENLWARLKEWPPLPPTTRCHPLRENRLQFHGRPLPRRHTRLAQAITGPSSGLVLARAGAWQAEPVGMAQPARRRRLAQTPPEPVSCSPERHADL
jgi:hypothetical protein